MAPVNARRIVRKNMIITKVILISVITMISLGYSQPLYNTYMNPVIPGDHPDPTLTKIGNHFYTSGSSFNPTPKIYHSTDLVHWEVIAQPVSASWELYGNEPGGGIWGGNMVYYDSLYWHFFGRGGGSMYFVTAENPEGPWSDPIMIQVPNGITGLGVDNSIFIDEGTGKWYLLAKHGREKNHIVELGKNGQPTGEILDLTWLNPDAEGNPYGWAEGPVMWKRNGYYFYSFAQHLAGSQYVMRSDTLTDDESAWTIFNGNIFTGSTNSFNTPNHISPAVYLDDSTSWVIAHSYHSSWYAQGRQGLLCQVIYNDDGFPRILRPSNSAADAPNLPSSGIPWMVPHSDNFNSDILDPEWSFLGYTRESNSSLTARPGWLKLSVTGRGGKTSVIKNDGEHNYSLITKLDFDPDAAAEKAGLWIVNGPQTHSVVLSSGLNTDGVKVIGFGFEDTEYEVENTIGSILWLKLVRSEHMMYGYYSENGFSWNQIGEGINAYNINLEQSQFNSFTGNQQGLFTQGKSAYFDLYIYRDAYSPILAETAVNQYGTRLIDNRYSTNSIGDISDGDWAVFAGIEFGNDDYPKQADSITVDVSCELVGGTIEVLLDSLKGSKIAELEIISTGDWDEYESFTTKLTKEVNGNHDIYLKFSGPAGEELLRLQTISFIEIDTIASSIKDDPTSEIPEKFKLKQNYPNPFNPTTRIEYSIPEKTNVIIRIYDLLGKEVATLHDKVQIAGNHSVYFDGTELSNGIYFYRIQTRGFTDIKKMLLLK